MKINNPVPKIDPFDVWGNYVLSYVPNSKFHPLFEKYGWVKSEQIANEFIYSLKPMELFKLNEEMKKLENENK